MNKSFDFSTIKNEKKITTERNITAVKLQSWVFRICVLSSKSQLMMEKMISHVRDLTCVELWLFVTMEQKP